jgi:hypothetical protein
MPFWPPFMMAGKQFVENRIEHRIKLIIQLNCRLIQNQATAPSIDPQERGFLCWVGLINRSHTIGGANGAPW